MKIKRYKVQHSIGEYTFPATAHIHAVRFDEKYMHVELTDQGIISIPLWWKPTVYNASEEDRYKFQINQDRTMIIWDPEESHINDEINIVDYLGPTRTDHDETSVRYASQETEKQVAESKKKTKK